MRARVHRSCALALVCVAVAGLTSACTTSVSPQKSAEERYLHALEDATQVYETTRQAVQRAYISGAITEAQRDTIAPYGRAAEKALRVATGSLNAWLALDGATDSGNVEDDLAALQTAVAVLVNKWRAAQ